MDEETGLIEEIRRFVVCIKSASGAILGTGVFLSSTTVLTCRHVIEDGESTRGAQDLSIVFYGREDDARVASRILTYSGDRAYQKDIALIELPEPFRAGERIPPWETGFPPTGAEVTFAGYRQRMKNQANPELVQTQTGYFESGRGCYMLMDGCTQGFSGGPVLYRRLGQWRTVGIVVANLQDRPNRTWCVPAETVGRSIEGLGHPVRLRVMPFGDERAACFRYLDDLKERHNPLGVFIDLGARRTFPAAGSAGSAADEILQIIDKSANATQRVFFFGHYGSGKTCVAIEAAARALAVYDPGSEVNKIPIYVELRDWKSLPSWTDMARYIAESDRYPTTSVSEVLELARQDRLFFLLDGLDELAGSLTVQGSLGLMQEIPRSMYDGASFIAFSRFSFFLEQRTLMEMLDDSEYPLPEILRERLGTSNYCAYAILPPQVSEIRQYLRQVCGADADYALKIVDDVYDLADLAQRPVMLSMIARCVPDLRREEPGLSRYGGSRIRSVDLYEFYILQWLRNPKHRSRLPQWQRHHVIEDLALHMWERQSLRIRYTDLAGFLAGRFENETLESLMYDIANCSFLDLVADGYEFSHKSFLEYFAASAMCRDIFNREKVPLDGELLVSVCMRQSPAQSEITGFLRDLVVRRLQAQPASVDILERYFSSPHRDDRAWAGHLLGHAAVDLGDDKLVGLLVNAYRAENDAWVKRSLALACGRAGRADVVRAYATELLPLPEHRFVNLKYHMEYYGSLRRLIEAVVSHLLSRSYSFLRPIDVFTLRQVMSGEKPLQASDIPVGEALAALLSTSDEDDDLDERVRSVGLHAVLSAVDEATTGVDW